MAEREQLERLVAGDLRHLTRMLVEEHGAETSGGLLGGDYGYGVHVDNEVFMMHPYCWCEREDCPWCLGCSCPSDAFRYFDHDGRELDEERLRQGVTVDFRRTEAIPERRCAHCRGEVDPEPNFRHKATGFEVRWYKYLGRGMELSHYDLNLWLQVARDCRMAVDRMKEEDG